MKTELKEMSSDEYKELLTEMLDYFHKLCERNNLKYFVAFGTLIGTIRHGGFIPWDDDIDVCMPRADYDRLIDIMNNSNNLYYMLTPKNSKYYYNNFSRFCSKRGVLKLKGVINIDNLGPFIDVMPLDKVPENESERLQYYQEVRKYYSLVKYSLPKQYYNTMNTVKKIKIKLNLPKRISAILYGTEFVKNKREELIVQYQDTNSHLLSSTFDIMSDELLLMDNEVENIEIHSFENISVCIPSEYDVILRRVYGNYMDLPPVEQRVSTHHFTPYWK